MSDIPVYYTSALKLVQILKRDYDLKRLEYRIKTYSRFRLMIVDEIVMCSLYYLDTYKREYIGIRIYKEESREGFLKLLHTPGHMMI